MAVRPGGATGRGWVKGQSGNPGGMSKAEQAYRETLKAAIRKQEPPKVVLTVIEAMRKQALRMGKQSPAAAKVYGEFVGLKDIVSLTEQERIQLGVRAELERLLGEAEAAQSRRDGAIEVTVSGVCSHGCADCSGAHTVADPCSCQVKR